VEIFATHVTAFGFAGVRDVLWNHSSAAVK
jgi:hypothetical protein